MKKQFTGFGLVVAVIIGISTFFVGCSKDDMNDVVLYKGQVVYINTTIPFPDLTVKVTNGQDTHCQTQTDAGGLFSLKVRVNEIDGNYYLLAGDETCVPKKVSLGGYGQAEVDLGVVEVEGPALPTVKTTPLTEVTAASATLGGEVMTDGRLAVTARGICYGTEQQPTVEGLHTTDGAGLGSFTTTLKNLDHNTIFYARAYATNKMGTAYGDQVKFTTELGVPIVISDSVYRITAHSAKCKGHVESDGGYAVSKKGTCWSRQPDPTVDDDCTNDGSGKGEFTSTLSGLLENTTYYVRTYATNATATVYGEQIIITTLDGLAVVKTDSVNNITATGFTAFGTVVSDCDIPVTARGFCYSTQQYPTIGDEHTTIGRGLGRFQSNITNLQISTTYYIRAYATNETGTTYGDQISVSTKDGLPLVETNEEATATALIINAGGTVVDNGGFTITDRGICYSSNNTTPTISDNFTSGGKGNGSFSVSIQNLTPATKYYLRAYATNENGTFYGKVISVTTKDGLPIVSTLETTATSTTISSGGNITSDGGYNITARGVCYSSNNSNPTIEDSYTTSGIGTGSFTTAITNVNVSTTYYVRAYATNSITTGYGDVVIVTTGDGLPLVETTIVGENVTSNTAIGGGNILDDGGYAVTMRGICWNTLPYPTISNNKTIDGDGLGYFSSYIQDIDISGSNIYYVRAYAMNEIGVSYGKQVMISKENIAYRNLPKINYGGYIYRLYKDIGAMIWSDANDACENLVYGGYDDWKLPTTEELLAIMNFTTSGWRTSTGETFNFVSQDTQNQVNPSAYYWTNTPYSSEDHYACLFPTDSYMWSFITYRKNGNPTANNIPDTNTCRVRPVRKYIANQ